MGAGDFATPEGDAGFDPLVEAPSVVAATMPEAWFFDPRLRLFPLENGEAVSVHPIDQAVALAALTAAGGLASVPENGLDTVDLRRASATTMQATVTDVVRRALAALVEAGDVEFLGAPLGVAGRPLFYVDYRNLRLAGAPQRKLSYG